TLGLSTLYYYSCERCGDLKKFRNCDGVDQEGPYESEANRRFIYASQVLGYRYEGMKKICAIMDFPPPVNINLYRAAVDKTHQATSDVSQINMRTAANQEAELTDSNDLTVSGDGTWQKRGYSSKNGVVTLVGVKTGKALDFEVMTTVCYGCSNYRGPTEGDKYEEWKKSHREECTVNHEGSSGLMEPVGMLRMFSRSEARNGVRYVRYVGDGDSKTYPTLVQNKPHGDTIPSKIECTGHVQKRMGTRLRALKKAMRGQKLSDGKTIGGAGRLTDKRIDQLSTYYGNAIRAAKDIK
ncbi:Replicase polyprotein 1ab, partial [Frankliniella fusca]